VLRAVVAFSILLTACGDNVPGNIQIRSPEAFRAALGEYATTTPYPMSVVAEDAPDGDGFTIAVVSDGSLPAQSYQLTKTGDREITVAAPDVLGAQYGTTAALEAMGFVFRHPYDIFVPRTITVGEVDPELHRPQIRVRGLQLHTLHPIEPYFAFWEPGEQNLADAKRTIDWLVKSRGNYLQWVALDDIFRPDRHAAWKAHTQAIIEYAHVRGVRVGLNIQLFGAANLQLAFDLVDDLDGDIPAQIAERLQLVTDGLDFDVYDLSFGEFFNSEPQFFIDSVNEVARQLGDVARQAEVHALVHVGAEQIVKFGGEELIYYFLIKFADPSIIPDVHTVMFYNLYEPAGGAYHHEDFSAHREFLLERMCSGQPVAYQPETSYWVAFDNSVPHYMPIYVHNRWLDLDMLDKEPCPNLDNHMLFTTGWEWGYWLHDYTALRASYELPAQPRDLIAQAFGTDLGNAVDAVVQLIDIQRQQLMLGELVQYIAGRDTAIDAGRKLGIVSQPDRITFDQLESGERDRDLFIVEVLQPLQAHDLALASVEDKLDAARLPDTRWGRELRDGITINRLRTKFVIEAYQAVVSHLIGATEDARRRLDEASRLMEQAAVVVAGRHGDLHDALGAKLIEPTTNRTFYQFGYLFMADTLCYWERELVQVRGILDGVSEPVPSCLF
jgi:hypothetical protein